MTAMSASPLQKRRCVVAPERPPLVHEPAADRFGRIQHVVEPARQGVDVLAIERGDEGAVQTLEDLGGNLSRSPGGLYLQM